MTVVVVVAIETVTVTHCHCAAQIAIATGVSGDFMGHCWMSYTERFIPMMIMMMTLAVGRKNKAKEQR